MGRSALELRRFEPSADLAPFVERHWVLRWNLGSGKHVQRVLGFPSVDLVFVSGEARVYGPMTRTLTHHFEGSGRVFGTKIRPGAWPMLSRIPVRVLVDRSMTLTEAFGKVTFDTSELAAVSDQEVARRVENGLRALAPRCAGRYRALTFR